MKRFTVLASIATLATLGSSLSLAASLTCEQIQQASIANAILKTAFSASNTNDLSAMVTLLKKAVLVSGSETETSLASQPLENIIGQYDPIFTNISIANKLFHSVNLSLGDNPYIYLFDINTIMFSGIATQDGSLYIDGEYCAVDSDLFS